jgi:hypothetical protein
VDVDDEDAHSEVGRADEGLGPMSPDEADEEYDAADQQRARPLLTCLRLANFKCYGQPEPGAVFKVPLAALTLVYGDNSAGKSTILQALLTFAQTLDWTPGPDDAWPRAVLDGAHLQLGTYRDVVHRHEVSGRTMRLGLCWRDSLGAESALTYQFGGEDGDLESIVLESFGRKLTFRRVPEIGERLGVGPVLLGEESTTADLPILIERGAMDTGTSEGRSGPRSGIDWAPDRFEPLVSLVGARLGAVVGWRSPSGQLTLARPTAVAATARFFDGIGLSLDQAFGGIRHLGPDRVLPAGDPVRVGDRVGGVGADGRLLVTLLANQSDGSAVIDALNEALEKPLALPYRLVPLRYSHSDADQAAALGIGQILVDVVLVRDGVPVAIGSGGYGFNHLLSILAEALRDRPWPLLIEQPETHINPKLQAGIAELLLNAATDPGLRSSMPPQLIIETHSENILLRLQALVAGTPILADDISVISVIQSAPGDSALPRHEEWRPDGDLYPGPLDVFPEARLRAVSVDGGSRAG